MQMKRILTAVFILSFFLAAPALRAEEPGLEGHWTGVIELPGVKLEVDLDFARQADGTWKGDISIPAQNARDLPLVDIVLNGIEFSCAISGIPGNPTFKGTLAAEGKAISGDFSQSGKTFPFSLKQGEDPALAAARALAGFDELVARGLKELDVPGVAVAIVKDGKVVLAKGYGYRDLEKKIPMTADTLLAIGSSSKAFTTFTLGVLVDRGVMDWDTPLRTYIPWFKLKDLFASERLTPRDLVTHRSGLPRHDLLWYNNRNLSREELVRRLAYLEPTADLRTRFQYNNLMFLTAGYLVETLTGKSWEQSVREIVFAPLGMSRSNFSVEDSKKDPDHAQPYIYRDKKITLIPFRNIDNVGPAGAINSSVNEMSRWLLVHLGGGKIDGRPIINPQTLDDLHQPAMPTGAPSAEPMIQSVGYALGWFVDTYRGHRMVHHGGNIDGFSAQVAFLPQDGIGVVALANMNGTALPVLLARHAADLLLGLEKRDWIAEIAKRLAEGRVAGEQAQKKGKERRVSGTNPAHKLDEYVGVYHHPGYGDLKVALVDKKLAFTYNGITTPLEHWHYETFNGLHTDDPTFEDFKITFGADVAGRVAWLEAQFEPTLEPIRLAKKPDAKLSDPPYLSKLAGRYQLPGQVATVSLKGEALVLVLPGQPEFDLLPRLGDEYVLKQVQAISIRFISDAKGNVTGLELNQAGAVFEAKRIEEKDK
jgi:CubicO group peptidase (beta-lactamase class C family)